MDKNPKNTPLSKYISDKSKDRSTNILFGHRLRMISFHTNTNKQLQQLVSKYAAVHLRSFEVLRDSKYVAIEFDILIPQ